ncbi:MAG TPA: histidine kinase [Bacteroidales bacterium]|jgi:hypothetical protein|nr:histidine kinase [Bacteroidales bacterium]
MEVCFTPSGTLDNFSDELIRLSSKEEVKSLFILACDENGFTPENCDALLQSIEKPIWGGLFPAIINNNKKYNKGTLIIGFKQEISLHIIKELSSSDAEFEEILQENIDDAEEYPTMAVIVDGFSRSINKLIESLFLVFGLEYNYIGGGAGSLSMVQKPCIFTNQGLKMDCAVIAGLKLKCGVGVQHGWTSIAGPYKVTSAEQNVIKTIDYKPAFEVYKEIVDEHSGKTLTKKNFFDISKAYPFGINKLNAEKVVRDPIAEENGNLVCVGELPEGSFIDVLHGNKESLIAAAGEAAKRSKTAHQNTKRTFDLFFDCISRVLFLEDDFTEELEAVRTDKLPLYGALSIGEIANNKKDYLEFYNKTAVLASFRE